MKIRNLLLTATAVTTAAVAMMSGGSADDVMTRSADGTYVVNTTPHLRPPSKAMPAPRL